MNNTHSSIAKPAISASDRLGFTLFLAIVIHALIILGVSFSQSHAKQEQSLPSLEIILAQSKSHDEPEDADFLSQENQSGGGSLKSQARPGAPVSADTPVDRDGFAERSQQKKEMQQNQAFNKKFLAQEKSPQPIQQAENQRSQKQTNQQHRVTQQHLEITRLRAEIKKLTDDYARRPKQITLTAATKKAIEASYLKQWVDKIERVGTINYPQEAHLQNISGALRMNVTINAEGKVIDLKISKPSGHSILDAAARRIVKLAEPFQPFKDELRQKVDQMVIIRTWEFSSQNQRMSTTES